LHAGFPAVPRGISSGTPPANTLPTCRELRTRQAPDPSLPNNLPQARMHKKVRIETSESLMYGIALAFPTINFVSTSSLLPHPPRQIFPSHASVRSLQLSVATSPSVIPCHTLARRQCIVRLTAGIRQPARYDIGVSTNVSMAMKREARHGASHAGARSYLAALWLQGSSQSARNYRQAVCSYCCIRRRYCCKF